MLVRELIEKLKELPQDYEVEHSVILAIRFGDEDVSVDNVEVINGRVVID